MKKRTKFKKVLVQSVGRSKLFSLCARLAENLDSGNRYLRVLTYHRVDHIDARPDLDPALISATPEQFSRQIEWLNKDYNVVSLKTVIEVIRGNERLPERAVLVTFDDAYLDFYTNAWPALQSKQVPVALFVPTAYPDNPRQVFWWDRLHHSIMFASGVRELKTPFGVYQIGEEVDRAPILRELKQNLKTLLWAQLCETVDEISNACDCGTPAPSVMSWDQLREVSMTQVALVPHTHTHPLLDRLPLDDVKPEIMKSRDVLRFETGHHHPAVAYPAGQFNMDVVNKVVNAQFEVGFTTVRGINRLDRVNPLLLNRINVGRATPDAMIRFQLTTISNSVQKLFR